MNIFISMFICSQIYMLVELRKNQGQAQKYCAITKVNHLREFVGKEIFYEKRMGFKCDIKNSNFTLDMDSFTVIAKKINEYPINKRMELWNVEFNWPIDKKASSLTKQFNISAFIDLFRFFGITQRVSFHNLKSIELDLFNKVDITIHYIYLINSDLKFIIDGRTVKTCADITSARNGTFKVSSLFQIPLVKHGTLCLFGCRFSHTLCPLIFFNSYFVSLRILDIFNTFYKRNLLKFDNQTFEDLNSKIKHVRLYRCENIVLDNSFLNPSVFRKLSSIYVYCSLSSISNELFSNLKKIKQIYIQTNEFHRLIHRNGIEWIKGINRGLHVNLSDLNDLYNSENPIKQVCVESSSNDFLIQISKVFPEEDFCIYKDYPFDQLVFTFQNSDDCKNNQTCEFLNEINPTYSCTYLWITQYLHLLDLYYDDLSEIRTLHLKSNLFIFLNSDSYKNRNNCNFESRLALCNRSDYQLKDIWGTQDYLILNIKIQIAVKILTYIISLFSIVTNLLVLRIIFAKHNKQVFKDFKHYTYLGLISVFNLFISLIEILSWLSECFYPFEVFCLSVHRAVVAQLFKMVVRECLVTVLRFLSNFCYIAFAFCRISLIDREHGKFIKFVSELTIWKYFLFSVVISIAFSWIKYFKYSINFGHGELNYPIWNEPDIATSEVILPPILDFYMVFNVISDLLNYLVFVILCFVVDINMLMRLRSTVNESIERIKKVVTNEKQLEKKKSELEDTMNKSIRMVVLNTSIGLLFKLPLVFLPMVKAIANFYYKDLDTRYRNHAFDNFYTHLFDADFYTTIQNFTELLYLISISIQYFIYTKFDKKFKEAKFSPPQLQNKSNQK